MEQNGNLNPKITFKVDFKEDWIRIIEIVIKEKFGLDTCDIPKDKILSTYLNLKRRIIEKQKRVVHESDIFECPAEKIADWEFLKSNFEKGNDVNIFQSTLIDKYNYRDMMLLDWNIHHFHLGTEMKGKFIKRDGPLLYAMITNGDVYAINIMPHKMWTDDCMIETLHRNWPNLIKKYRSNNITPDQISEEQRNNLRKKHCNATVSVLDGTTYFPIGGGYVASGESISSIVEIDKQNAHLDMLESVFRNNIQLYMDAIRRNGYIDGNEIEAVLEYNGKDYAATIPKYKTKIEFNEG